MASTLRMPTTISPGQWQPWTAVSPLLGLISMAAVGSKTLYFRGECKSAIPAYMAGIRREREGDFFFSPQYPLPFMHLPSTLHPMKGNPDSEMRKIFACGIRNPENFACEIRNPGLWSPEHSLRNSLTIKSRIHVLMVETEIQFLES